MEADLSSVVKNTGCMMEEIEIEIQTMDDESFASRFTVIETKHGIYRDCLGFRD